MLLVSYKNHYSVHWLSRLGANVATTTTQQSHSTTALKHILRLYFYIPCRVTTGRLNSTKLLGWTFCSSEDTGMKATSISKDTHMSLVSKTSLTHKRYFMILGQNNLMKLYILKAHFSVSIGLVSGKYLL